MQMGKILFIVGGARSGKSRYAEKLAHASKKQVTFIATGEGLDREMRERIMCHKNARPKHWVTVEEPRCVSAAVKTIPADACILIDCLTLLVSNLILKKVKAAVIEEEAKNIVTALKKRRGPSILVSNEVGLGIVPASRLGREFRDVAGRVNQIVAGESHEVYFMVSGIPWRVR